MQVGDDVGRILESNRHAHHAAADSCRGKLGIIHLDHGVFVFPDTNALGQGPKTQHCYSVRFSAHELWGNLEKTSVYIDLWDDYLERA